jgi:hypothetical protein
MEIKHQELIQVKSTKNLKMYYDIINHELLFEKDNVFFSLSKNEIYPALRGMVSALQRFYRKKIEKR